MKRNSRYQVLRCLVALVQIEAGSRVAETDWLKKFVAKQTSDPGEMSDLENAFEIPPDYFEEFKNLSSYVDREMVLEKARILFHIDGQFQENEMAAYRRMYQVHQELSKNLKDSFHGLGRELVGIQKKNEMYRELDEFGRELSTPVRIFSFRHFSPALYLLVTSLILKNRVMFWAVVVFLFLFIGIPACVRWVH